MCSAFGVVRIADGSIIGGIRRRIKTTEIPGRPGGGQNSGFTRATRILLAETGGMPVDRETLRTQRLRECA